MAAGLRADDALVTGLVEQAAEHAVRVAVEAGERERVAALGLPTCELPFLPDGVDLGALYDLARRLGEQGLPGLPARTPAAS